MKYSHNEYLHFQIYEKISAKFNQDWHEEVIRLSDPICKNLDEINRLNRAIWYFRAMSFDLMNKSSEALAILKQLVELYPIEPFYRKSFKLALFRLEVSLCERKGSKLDDSIENCIKFLEENHYISFEVRRIHLSFLLENKRFNEISEIVNKYLDINPFEYDYLSSALALAADINDNILLKRVLSILDSIPPYHIDRIKIDGLLFEFFNNSQESAFC